MLTTSLLIAALNIPAVCGAMGEMYAQAASVRDQGVLLTEALDNVKQDNARRAVIHVYQDRTMSPDQWRYFIMGVCLSRVVNEGKV
jgi:hypothetical protein